MVSMTLSIPSELKKEMDEFPELNWSAVARKAIQNKLAVLREVKDLLKDSDMTEEDALELGRKVNEAVARRYKRELNN